MAPRSFALTKVNSSAGDKLPVSPPLPTVWRFWFGVVCVLATLYAGSITTGHAETTSASGATAVTSVPCQITASGTYYLAQDFTLTSDTPYAINITAANVTLDFNGHTIFQNAGTNSSTIGVYIGADNVTVHNGTIAGCLYGVYLYGNNGCIEDMFAVASTFWGIVASGSNHTVRHCRVNNVGGETVPNLAPYAVGITLSADNSCVVDCDVTTLTPGPGCYTVCVEVGFSQNVLIVNNRFCAAIKGTESYGGTGKIRDNLSVDINYPYNGGPASLEDAGNNQ